MFSVGDTVKIKAPADRAKTHRFGWMEDMDKYDGKTATVTYVHQAGDDYEYRAYDLDIDNGEFGWMEIWLLPAT